MGDRAGVARARRQDLAAKGTLAMLGLAARQALIELAGAFALLQATSFYYRQGLLGALLARRRQPSN